MTPRHATRSRARSPRHATSVRRHRVLRPVALGLTAVMAFGATSAATAYTRLQGNISTGDTDHLLGSSRPPEVTPDPNDPNAGAPVNILVMGTDSRDGNESIASDQVAGERSDTTIVVHISGDRERIDLVSIPRDSLVDVPECERSDGTTAPARYNAMFNSAFAGGGENGSVTDAAACTQKTVESITGVRIHHYVVVDMSGFVDLVDALGGVPICIPQDMKSTKAKLDVQAGNQTLDGTTALAFARARTGDGVGDGSDTGRIVRQQELLAATAREVLDKNLLTDVPELYRFLTAATRSLTVSKQISSLPDLSGLAFSLREVSGGNINLMTIPVAAAPSDPNRLVWTSEAEKVWANMAADLPIVPEKEPEPTDETDGATESPGTEEPGTDDAEGTDEEPGTEEEPDSTETERPDVDSITADEQPAVCG